MLRGRIAGFKWTTYVVGPVAVIMLLLVVGAEAWLISIGRSNLGEAFHAIGSTFGFYLSSCLWGILIGTVAAGVRYAFGGKH